MYKNRNIAKTATCLLLIHRVICGLIAPDFQGGKNEIITDPSVVSDEPPNVQKIRLRGKNRSFGSGRLEVYYRKRWNLICNKFFTEKEADVACRWLGFKNGAKSFTMGPKYGGGSATDLIQYKFDCQGSEPDLFACKKSLEKIVCDPVRHTLTIECRLNYISYCAANEVAFERLCYLAINNRSFDFRRAQFVCQSFGGTLAQIRDQETMNFLSEYLTFLSENGKSNKSTSWYMAGYRPDEQLVWKWLTRVSVPSTNYVNWIPGFIDEERNNCILLRKDEPESGDYYFWDAADCNTRLGFICQKSLDFNIGCTIPQSDGLYDGLANVTVDDTPCKKWNDPQVLRKYPIFHNQSLMDHNYCRNSGNDPKPYCLTDAMKLSHCDVPVCKSKSSRMCDETEIQCSNSNNCIPLDFVCDGVDDCGNSFDEISCYDCGKRRTVRVARDANDIFNKKYKIVGGTETNPGDYPWMVSIKSNGKHHCGGAIIDGFRILTAAHCFDQGHPKAEFVIVAGDWDNSVNEGHEVERNISRIIAHPDYNGKSNDIALVELDSAVGLPFNEFIQPVCLSTNYTPVDINVTCFVSGWGSLGEDVQTDKQYPKRLQAAQIPIISRPECTHSSAYGNTIPEQAFCAGFLGGGIDACKGDSGSPLVCNVKGRFYLFGIASRGWECAKAGKPGIYTSVKYYVTWIRQWILGRK